MVIQFNYIKNLIVFIFSINIQVPIVGNEFLMVKKSFFGNYSVFYENESAKKLSSKELDLLMQSNKIANLHYISSKRDKLLYWIFTFGGTFSASTMYGYNEKNEYIVKNEDRLVMALISFGISIVYYQNYKDSLNSAVNVYNRDLDKISITPTSVTISF